MIRYQSIFLENITSYNKMHLHMDIDLKENTVNIKQYLSS